MIIISSSRRRRWQHHLIHNQVIITMPRQIRGDLRHLRHYVWGGDIIPTAIIIMEAMMIMITTMMNPRFKVNHCYHPYHPPWVHHRHCHHHYNNEGGLLDVVAVGTEEERLPINNKIRGVSKSSSSSSATTSHLLLLRCNFVLHVDWPTCQIVVVEVKNNNNNHNPPLLVLPSQNLHCTTIQTTTTTTRPFVHWVV